MSSPRCAEDANPKEDDAQLSKIVKSFNDNLQPLVPDLAVITPDEVKPSKVEGLATVYEFWQKPHTRKLLADLRALRFGTEEQQAIRDVGGGKLIASVKDADGNVTGLAQSP